MIRLRRWAGMALVVPALGLAGCGGSATTNASTSGAMSPAVSRPPALELSGPRPSTAPSGAGSSRAGEPQVTTVVVSNLGAGRDTLLLQLVPASAGAVSPGSVELDPGRSASVQVVLGPNPGPARLVETSRATGQTVATLDLRS